MTLDPSFRNGRINPALEIAVPHFEELMPPQYSSDGDFVFREHREDLQCRKVIRSHDIPHVVNVAQTISEGRRTESSSANCPPILSRACEFHKRRIYQACGPLGTMTTSSRLPCPLVQQDRRS